MVGDFAVGFGIFVVSEDSDFEGLVIFAGGALLGDALLRLPVIFFGDGLFGETFLEDTFFFTGEVLAGDSS